MGSGMHATWINSDDLLCKDALFTHMSTHEPVPDVMYIGDCINVDQAGQALCTHRSRVHCFEDLVRFGSVWSPGGYICQQEVLFPLEMALGVGGLNEDNHYSMDYELWGRLLLAGARVQYTAIPFGVFRLHAAQKTKAIAKLFESSLDAAEALLAAADMLDPEIKQDLLSELATYRREYPAMLWKKSGRLARLGLPPSVVLPIRRLRTTVTGAVRSFRRPA